VFTVENPVGEVTFTPPPTVRARSVSQKGAEFPHALTRKVCDRQQWNIGFDRCGAALKYYLVHHRQNKPCWLWVVHYSLRIALAAARASLQRKGWQVLQPLCRLRRNWLKAKATNRVTNIHDLAVENDSCTFNFHFLLLLITRPCSRIGSKSHTKSRSGSRSVSPFAAVIDSKGAESES